MATIITVSNQKGGVGRTTTSAALATGLRLIGGKALRAGLGPQGNPGFYLGLEVADHHIVLDVLKGLAPVRGATCQTDYCDILAFDITSGSGAEQVTAEHRECTLKNTLAPVMKECDYAIIDTPPALNPLAVSAYTVSDFLVVPMASDILGLVGLTRLKETIESVKGGLSPRLHVLGILLTRYNKRTLLSREVLGVAEQLVQQINTVVFESRIRNGVTIAETPVHGGNIFGYNPRSAAVKDYMASIDETAGTIHLREA